MIERSSWGPIDFEGETYPIWQIRVSLNMESYGIIKSREYGIVDH